MGSGGGGGSGSMGSGGGGGSGRGTRARGASASASVEASGQRSGLDDSVASVCREVAGWVLAEAEPLRLKPTPSTSGTRGPERAQPPAQLARARHAERPAVPAAAADRRCDSLLHPIGGAGRAARQRAVARGGSAGRGGRRGGPGGARAAGDPLPGGMEQAGGLPLLPEGPVWVPLPRLPTSPQHARRRPRQQRRRRPQGPGNVERRVHHASQGLRAADALPAARLGAARPRPRRACSSL